MSSPAPRLENVVPPFTLADGRLVRLARYYSPAMHLPGGVAIAASFHEARHAWRAYIGAVSVFMDFSEAAQQVTEWGVKLEEHDARWFFPDVEDWTYER